ncbi:MAG: DUF4142 domain-containing protein [Bradymonadaceae bacterium]
MHSIRCRPCSLGVVAALVAVGLCLPVAAQEGEAPDEAPPKAREAENPKKAPVDVEVLRRMHMINQFEIRAGKMAIERGELDNVQDLGERLMQDHRVAENKVTDVANELDIQLPPVNLRKMMKKPKEKLTKRQQKLISAMKKMKTAKGPAFDRAYVQAMRKTHRMAIRMLEKKREAIDLEPVASLVENVLPILGQHRALALEVHEELEELEAEPEA